MINTIYGIILGVYLVTSNSTLTDYMLGDIDVTYMTAFYLFAFLGMALSMALHYKGKHKKSRIKFNLGFFLKDNLVRIIVPLIIIFAVLRFESEFQLDIEPGMYLGFLSGLGMDRLIMKLRAYTNVFGKVTPVENDII